jgi:fatty acid amide hydrolase
MVEAHVRRIESVNPALNAVVVPLFEQAVAEARAADTKAAREEWLGALHGLPITIKETFDLVGTASTEGVARWATTLATRDAPAVAALRDAGAIVLGKTNLSQAGWFNESDNPIFGRTNNPWNLDRSPGGSSGGEAAIVAAGGSPLGLGADSGGSIRHPAHSCGIFGLKPTSGRLTTAGTAEDRIYEGQEGVLNQPGPIARRVADLELALEVLCRPSREATFLPPLPLGDRVDVRSLRVGICADNGLFRPSPAIRRAVVEAGRELEGDGMHVEEFALPRPRAAWRIYNDLFLADGHASLRRFVGDSELDPRVERALRTTTEPMPASRYLELIAARNAYRVEFVEALDEHDLHAILCPPDGLPALTHGAGDGLGDAQSYAALFNLLGLPAGVVPATSVRPGEESDRAEDEGARHVELNSTGLPVGVQVVARPWREEVVLALMAVLEDRLAAAGAPVYNTPSMRYTFSTGCDPAAPCGS